MSDLYKDFAYTRILNTVSATDTLISVEDVTLFPSNAVLAKGEFWLSFESALTYPNTFEIVKLTNVDTTNKQLTVVRGQDGTTAVGHDFGTYLKGALTAEMLRRTRAGLSGATVPTGTDPDLYSEGDRFYESSTGKSYVYDSTNGFTLLSGGGGGALDTAMPTPSTPTVFERGLTWGIQWDGRDTSGALMPAGFQRAVIEQVKYSAGTYSSVGVDFDATGLANATPAAIPTGWTAIGGATLDIASGVYVSDVASTSKPLGVGNSWIGVECNGSYQRAKVSMNTAVWLTMGLNTIDGTDWTSTLVNAQMSGTELSLAFYGVTGNNTYVAGAAPVTSGWTGGATFDLKLEADTYTLYAADGTVFATGSMGLPSPIASGTKFAISPGGASPQGIISVALSATQPVNDGWQEIASLSGAGVAFTSQTGSMGIRCVNEAGNAGTRTTFSVTAPTMQIKLIPPAAADPTIQSPTDVVISGLADGDVLTYQANVKLFTNKQPTLPGFTPSISAPTDQQILMYSAANNDWYNTDGSALTAGGDVTGPLNALVVDKINGVAVGNAATKNVGTTADTVAAGDDSRFAPGPFDSYTVENSSAHGQILIGDTTADNVYWMEVTTALPQASSARWYAMVRPAGAITTSNALGNGVMRLIPVFLSKSFNVKSVAINITAAGDSGSVVRVGFYAPKSGNFLYNEDIPKLTSVGTGVTIAANTTGVQTVNINGGVGVNLTDSGDPTTPLTGTPFIWLAVAVQGVTTTQPTLSVCTPMNAGFPIAADSASAALTTPPFGFQATGVTGAFANNPTLVQCNDMFPMVACLTV